MATGRRTLSLALALALVLALSLAVPALAADSGKPVTRGEFITELCKLYGPADAAESQGAFSDAPAEGELGRALGWAVENGIVNGYGNDIFGAEDPVTREQAAAMLYRHAQTLGKGFRGMWMFLLDYPDAGQIAQWADEAMHWVVMQEVLTAANGGLEPQAPVAAEELPALLERYQSAVRDGEKSGIDYLALVNKLNALPEDWEDALETVHVTNSVGDDVEVEKKAYDAYLKLKEDLERNDGIYLELDSARRSVAAQQEIMDRYIEKYGPDYAAKTVATPGYSEHHTGLALDLYFRLDGKDVYYNEDMIQYPEIWEKIHAKLADYGFILRYLEGKEHITGYGYEPWHIRYLDSVDIAKEIMSKPGLTLEVWLGAVSDPDVTVDYGDSKLYTKEDFDAAVVQIKCRFSTFAGCELHSLRYAGDECSTEENLKWMNSLDEGKEYVQVMEFFSDFHSPAENAGAWEADKEYADYQWWLAREKDGGWVLLSYGYA